MSRCWAAALSYKCACNINAGSKLIMSKKIQTNTCNSTSYFKLVINLFPIISNLVIHSSFPCFCERLDLVPRATIQIERVALILDEVEVGVGPAADGRLPVHKDSVGVVHLVRREHGRDARAPSAAAGREINQFHLPVGIAADDEYCGRRL
jgi:hypothetical protein